jgi:hypothetical protein
VKFKKMKSLLRLLLLVVVSQALPLAWAGQVQGDFLPEKQTYSVGEPAFVQLHVKNQSPDSLTNWLARRAVAQNPPRFLESVILDMADDPQTAGYSVVGLERLGTPRAKAKLAKVSKAGDPEAIQALAGLGDPAYCGTMLDITRESREYSRLIALRAAGHLCGEKVLPLATAELASADPSPRFEAAYALGNSHTREAVPLLISLLPDPDENVRRAARDSLATLTHRRSKNDGGPTQSVFRDWNNWWRSSGATAPIYGIGECKEAEPLP